MVAHRPFVSEASDALSLVIVVKIVFDFAEKLVVCPIIYHFLVFQIVDLHARRISGDNKCAASGKLEHARMDMRD
jgi:hypothetical protein